MLGPELGVVIVTYENKRDLPGDPLRVHHRGSMGNEEVA